MFAVTTNIATVLLLLSVASHFASSLLVKDARYYFYKDAHSDNTTCYNLTGEVQCGNCLYMTVWYIYPRESPSDIVTLYGCNNCTPGYTIDKRKIKHVYPSNTSELIVSDVGSKCTYAGGTGSNNTSTGSNNSTGSNTSIGSNGSSGSNGSNGSSGSNGSNNSSNLSNNTANNTSNNSNTSNRSSQKGLISAFSSGLLALALTALALK